MSLATPARPFIMAPVFADELMADGRLDENMDHPLIKPFPITELRDAVARLMR